MKYVIKQDSDYVILSSKFDAYPSLGFDYSIRLDLATQFTSINAAIDAIQRRLQGNTPKSFTIVGIKEVSTPRYEEVIL